jgi:16S rRNA (guanine966-N2)-methyltransferase
VRIVAGRWRGREIEAPPGLGTRPTAARAREALFSMLVARLGSFDGLRVLDLFAGSGALGLEALSRGAVHARFVEQFAGPLGVLRRNITALGAGDETDVLRAAVEKLGPAPTPHDLVFADPPYHMGLGPAALTVLVNHGWLAPGAWIVLETAHDDALPGWVAQATRDYGKARLTLLRWPQP